MIKQKSGCVIYYNGGYPNGSSANRVRLWQRGFVQCGLNCEILIGFPGPIQNEVDDPQKTIHFMLKPRTKDKTSRFVKVYEYFTGISKSVKFVRGKLQIDFVIMLAGSFLECYWMMKYCQRHKIIFALEMVDENSKRYFEGRKTLFDYIAMINKYLFDLFIVKNLDVLFVISSYLENKYRKIAPQLKIVRSCPTIIDLIEFREKRELFLPLTIKADVLNSTKLKILYAGSCVRTNGLKFFLECAAEIILIDKEEIEIIFYFHIGDQNPLKKYVQMLGIQHNVHFLGKISQKYLPAIYNFADILILPEHGDIIANAGFPGKTAELLASGKAILATNFSDLGFYLKNNYNAMISPVGDKNAYLNNFRKLLNDPKLRCAIGEKGYLTAHNFDYFKASKSILAIISQHRNELP